MIENDTMNVMDSIEQRMIERNESIHNMINQEYNEEKQETHPIDGSIDTELFKNKLADVERREAEIQSILSSLKDVYASLKRREELLNKREARLAYEYELIKKMEDEIRAADSLEVALPTLGDGINETDGVKE